MAKWHLFWCTPKFTHRSQKFFDVRAFDTNEPGQHPPVLNKGCACSEKKKRKGLFNKGGNSIKPYVTVWNRKMLRFSQTKMMEINGPVVGGARGGNFTGTYLQPFCNPFNPRAWFL